MDHLLLALQIRNGVARTDDLLAAGVTERTLRAAISRGLVLRARRGVIALPEADPLLARSIATGSRLTCASAAKSHGLWLIHDPDKGHIQRTDGRYRSERSVVHRRTWVPAPPGGMVASLADVVLHCLECLPDLEALMVVESAIQTGTVQGLPQEQAPRPAQRPSPRGAGPRGPRRRLAHRDRCPRADAQGRPLRGAASVRPGGGLDGHDRRAVHQCRARRRDPTIPTASSPGSRTSWPAASRPAGSRSTERLRDA